MIDAAPVVTRQPAAATISSGGNSVLTVSATGDTLSYQWYRGASGDSSSPVPGAIGPMLLTPVLRENSVFWVRVSDATGDADSAAAAVTLGPPAGASISATGSNYDGNLGNGSFDSLTIPEVVAHSVIRASAGSSHSLFVMDDGSLWATGSNSDGQYGDGSTVRRFVPTQVATGVIRAVTGGYHSLVLKTDGTLWGAGHNTFHQLGDGTSADRATPVQMADSVVQMAAGQYHSLYVKADGSLWATGYNSDGQLGNGTVSSVSTAVKIADYVLMAATCDRQSFFVQSDGTLWAMGANSYGQLGDGSFTRQTSPVPVATGVVQVAAGGDHSLFIKADGTLWSMGNNNYGQLGNHSTANSNTPVKVAYDVVSIAAGDYHSLFLKTDHTLWASGQNYNGQFGNGTTVGSNFPVQVADSISSVTAAGNSTLIRNLRPTIHTQSADAGVLAGAQAGFSVGTDGDLPLAYQWYRGSRGDTSLPISGAGSAAYQTPPAEGSAAFWVRVENPYGTADSRSFTVQAVTLPVIENGPDPTVAIEGNNASLSVASTGGMVSYQWYRGESGDVSHPVSGATGSLLVTPAVNGETRFWVRATNAAGTADSAAASVGITPRVAANLRSAGSAVSGQLGTGVITSSDHPVPFANGVAKVSSTAGHTLILKADGNLWEATVDLAPVSITDGVTAIASSSDMMAFVKGDGSLWGKYHDEGSEPQQLATGVVQVWIGSRRFFFLKTDGSLWSRSVYSPLTGDELISGDVVTAASGDEHLLFIKTDGTLWGWGANDKHQLGSGYAYGSSILLSSGVVKVAAGPACSYFVKTDGTLWVMGDNPEGQLGSEWLGESVETPIAIATGVSDVSAGGDHTLYITKDGSLWGLGLNHHGQLGDGTAVSRPLPVRIARQVIQASGGTWSTWFITADGTLWRTGSNASGNLGDPAAPESIGSSQVTENVVAIAAGDSHSLLVKADGSLWAFGANADGQLGDGSRSNRSLPVPVATEVSMATAGFSHSLFVKNDGTLWAMGNNENGQLGDGTLISNPVPQQVAVNVASASAGTRHSLFLKKDGTLWAMGANSSGQFGNGTSAGSSIPVQIARDVVAATAGGRSSFHIKSDGTLWGTGTNIFGQLGDGTTQNRYSWIQVATGVTGVTASTYHTLFLKSDATLWGMGTGGIKVADSPDQYEFHSPVQVASNVGSAAAGSFHNLFVKIDNTVWAMGSNGDNQLGEAGSAGLSAPAQVATGGAAVAAGNLHSLWLTTTPGLPVTAIAKQPTSSYLKSGDATVLTVEAVGGGSIAYQWYAGLPGDVSQPVEGAVTAGFIIPPVTTNISYWVRATAAGTHADSEAAQLMVLDLPAIVTQPWLAGMLPGGGARLAVIGSSATFSYQWFRGAAGDASHPLTGTGGASLLTLPVTAEASFWVRLTNAVGTADSGIITVSPSPAVAGRFLKLVGAGYANSLLERGSAVTQAVTGTNHRLFVKTSGTLWAFGSNSSGQFGNGTTSTNVTTPVKVAENVRTAAVGASHSLFIRNDGTLWGMGSNNYAQLGDGTRSTRTSPVQVAQGVVGVAACENHSLFVNAEGTLWGMGSNNYGQLGSITTVSETKPQRIAENVALVATAQSHTLFVKKDGTLWAMGSNAYGKIGAGSVASSFTPLKIAEAVVAITVGESSSFFITSDGTMRAMGYNRSGQLGYGPIESDWAYGLSANDSGPPAPPRIMATDVMAAAAGAGHSLWLKNDNSLWSSGRNSYGQLCITRSDTLNPPQKALDRVNSIHAAGDISMILTTNDVIEPPVIISHPASVIVAKESSATFAVVASGAAPLAYQWYSGAVGNTTKPITGAVSASYTTPPLGALMEVWVKVSNAAASSESRTGVATLAVTAYEKWAVLQNLDLTNMALAADPDHDGLTNLAEYALSTRPLSSSGDDMPAASVIHQPGQDLLALVHRRRNGSNIGYNYQYSGNLNGWTDISPAVEMIDPDIDGDGSTALVRVTRPVAPGETGGFLRIRFLSP